MDPTTEPKASWKQLLGFSRKLSTVTHLSLAFWPAPSQGRPCSPDGDWSETLVALKLLSRNLYRLEYLDLTGCALWYEALKLENGHDRIDWVWAWGKVSTLRLYVGWTPGEDAPGPERHAHGEAIRLAKSIERHIVGQRAGKAMPITVEHDKAV